MMGNSNTSSVPAVLQRLKPPVHVSHRGGRHAQFGPENTLYSYRKSVLECKTQVLEIDLWLSKDGHIMLYHDSDISTNTNGSGCINDKTLEELQQYDAAWRFSSDDGKTYPLRGQGYTIPTLNQVLDEFIPVLDLVFFFDFKDDKPINLALETISKKNLQNRVIFGAVEPEINQILRKKKPKNVPLAADFATMKQIHGCYVNGTLANLQIEHEIVGFMVDNTLLSLLNEQLFQEFHKKGKWIALFGPALNNEDIIRRVVSLDTDLILSDRPDLLRSVLDSL
jgi:glycerophosphoryl diester phosphodiesterase